MGAEEEVEVTVIALTLLGLGTIVGTVMLLGGLGKLVDNEHTFDPGLGAGVLAITLAMLGGCYAAGLGVQWLYLNWWLG